MLHPYWDKPYAQIAGWASGDVLCLGKLPHVAFYAPPNWAEVTLACLAYGIFCLWSSTHDANARVAFESALLAPLVEAAMLFPRFYFFANGLPKNRVLVTMLAVTPPMLQDVIRLASKLRRGRLSEIGRHFDWMNKTGQHPDETRSNIKWKLAAWLITAWAVRSAASRQRAVTTLVILYTLWVCRHHGALMVGEWRRLVQRPGLEVEVDSEKTPFVVLAYQRTGSNMLVRNFLNKHPEILMHFELFNEKAIYTQSNPGVTTSGAIRDIAAIRARDRDPASFLSRTISGGAASTVGFKLFPEHVQDEEFVERLLADRRIRKVVLRRENGLACLTSIVRASVTGRYIHKSHDDIAIHLSPKDVQAWYEGYDRYYSFLRDRLAGQRYEEITYEAVVANHKEALAPVYELLGLASPKRVPVLEGDLKPQSSGEVGGGVENFDELRKVFASTKWASDFGM